MHFNDDLSYLCKGSWMLTNPSIIYKFKGMLDRSDRKDKTLNIWW